MRVAILVNDDFEQVELTEPRKALEGAGARTVLISPHAGQVQAFNHDQKGDKFSVDLVLDQANPDDFDGLLLPGGALNADSLRMVRKAQDFARQFDQDGKPMAVICHAPWLLVSSGLVDGRRLTSYYTLQDDIRNAGGHWQDREVIHDRNWVTSRSPKDLPAFNQAMIDLFAEVAEAGGSAQAVMGAGTGDRDPHPSGMPGSGQGRTDQVGGSGVYLASDPYAPWDASLHGVASWGQDDRDAAGYDDSDSPELDLGPEDEDE
ncbi:MAG TPA: type 1 glutamine amidotransferase domain-containing protein [Anaerolineaceae bacterium]|jgi:protease I